MTAAPSDSSTLAAPFRILVLPGDGIGREVIPAALEVLRATGLPFDFVTAEAGWECFQQHGTSLPDATLAAARAADAILFGAVSSPSHPVVGYRSPIVGLRRALDLYANIRPVKTKDERGTTKDGGTFVVRPSSFVDLVVVRENTEGLYAGLETSDGETAVAQRVITRRASERIAQAAFELARQRTTTDDRQSTTVEQGGQWSVVGRRSPRVTVVHKANVMRETCGLFRATALKVAERYPDVTVDEQLVDSAALQLVQRPERFDVLVTTNMFGDILSDVASYWCGGLGMATSANIGDNHALFEPVHGSAPDIAGKGIANPLAAIGCAAMLLDHLANRSLPDTQQLVADECRVWATRIRAAITATLAGDIRTPDLGGTARTADVTHAIITTMANDG
ncbi:MAG: isocitrate/isopropylmalate dehydrogenase family protein [Roseiflexaceae bacterium]